MKNSDLEELKEHLRFINENYINANELVSIIESKKNGDRPWVEMCVLNEIIAEVKKLLEAQKVSIM